MLFEKLLDAGTWPYFGAKKEEWGHHGSGSLLASPRGARCCLSPCPRSLSKTTFVEKLGVCLSFTLPLTNNDCLGRTIGYNLSSLQHHFLCKSWGIFTSLRMKSAELLGTE